MTKREKQLLKEIVIGLAWRIPLCYFALLGAFDWYMTIKG